MFSGSPLLPLEETFRLLGLVDDLIAGISSMHEFSVVDNASLFLRKPLVANCTEMQVLGKWDSSRFADGDAH